MCDLAGGSSLSSLLVCFRQLSLSHLPEDVQQALGALLLGVHKVTVLESVAAGLKVSVQLFGVSHQPQ